MTKYKNIKSGGYDSKKEQSRAHQLALLQKAGAISGLREQVRFQLIPSQPGERATHYVADFVYTMDGKQVVEDVKSPASKKLAAYIIKRKLMLQVFGIKIVEV